MHTVGASPKTILDLILSIQSTLENTSLAGILDTRF